MKLEFTKEDIERIEEIARREIAKVLGETQASLWEKIRKDQDKMLGII